MWVQVSSRVLAMFESQHMSSSPNLWLTVSTGHTVMGQEVRGLDLQRWGLKVEAMGRIGRKDVPGRRHSIYKGPKMR